MYKILLTAWWQSLDPKFGKLLDPDPKRCLVTCEDNTIVGYLELWQLIKLQAAEVGVVSLYRHLVPG